MRHLLSRRRSRVLAAAALLAAAAASSPVAAAPPANDAITSPRVVSSVPYYATQDTRQATSSPGDGECVDGQSVWYKYRPTTSGQVRVVTVGSDYDTVLAVFSGFRNNRTLVACSDDTEPYYQSTVLMNARAGTTYWIAVSSCCNAESERGGRAVLRLYRPRPAGVWATVTGAQAGTVSGRLTVSGTIRCNTPSWGELYVSVSQAHGAEVVEGRADGSVSECTGTRRTWSVRVDSTSALAFRAGQATVDLTATSYDGSEFVNTAVTSVVTVTSSPSARVGR